MAKKADRYFVADPWRVLEEGFDPARAQVSESIFSLANEYMGVRGFCEEGYARDIPSMIGCYLGGVYELDGEETPGGYKGIVKQTHYMVNAANWLRAELTACGERVLCGGSPVRGFSRALDMRTGVLRREYTVDCPGGTLHARYERVLCMEDPRLAAQRITLSAKGPIHVELALYVDAAQVHYTNNRCRWQGIGAAAAGDAAYLAVRTETTGFSVRYDARILGMPPGECATAPLAVVRRAAFTLTALIVIEKDLMVRVARPGEQMDDNTPEYMTFEEIESRNKAHFSAFWENSDVVIDGETETQQGIRYCLFQMHATYRGYDRRNNIGAKGLTGEAYNGHAFWDTETYCLPYYLLNDPQAARTLLMFRYQTLPQAKARARQLDCEGACYPIATLNGNEACTLWQHASLQMQPTTAVAYGIWNYAQMTHDTAFLYHEGIEMLVEICRYLISRGNWNADHTAFGFYGVMGPDEFHLMVNNNYYTNLMGRKALFFTLNTLASMPENPVPPAETERWRRCAEAMLLLCREDGVFEQHEGFFSLPHLNVHAIPREEFPLYEHWSYDRIYRTDMIKQPDVLMTMFLYPGDYDRAAKQANYDYYEPRCIHESSLSPSVHSILAGELGMRKAAVEFFGFATRLDLDNYNRNTAEGLHLASIAAAWVTIVFGFGILRTDGGLPSLAPFLPDNWEGYSFRIRLCGSVIAVRVEQAGTRLSLLSGAPVTLLLYGERMTVQ
jgi:maltose phosphorylase